jgi:hypothetical protein
MAKARRSERHSSGFPFFLSRLPSTTMYLVPFLPAPLNVDKDVGPDGGVVGVGTGAV